MFFEGLKFIAAAAFLVIGLCLLTVSVIGNFKFKNALNRIHASALSDTCGILFIIIAFMIYMGPGFTLLKLLLLIVTFWLAAPVASHMLAVLFTETHDKKDGIYEIRNEDKEHGDI